jgi:pimeloyl-ACP methyl ester carboxylesterase
MSEAVMREGTLITYKSGVAVGRERFRDDGSALVSEILLGQAAVTVTLTREPRRLRLDAGEERAEREVPDSAIVLENGSWQAFALAAERFPEAAAPVAVDVVIPSLGTTAGGTIAVRPIEGGGRRVDVVIHGLQVEVDLDAAGSVVAARVPAQGVEARPEGAPAPAPEAPRAPPPGVTEEAFEETREGVTLRGALWLPASAASGKVPVVLLIAGSGPTDRDGNSSLGLRTDAYRLVAEALAARGIASLRYDKRGVGASGREFDPATTVLDDFAADALAVAHRLRVDPLFSRLALLGHSEGGLLALMIAERAAPDALLLLATPGRPLAVLLREQLARKLDPRAMDDVDRVLDAIRRGAPPDPIPAPLAPLFAPTVRAFLRSALDLDPLPLLRAARARVTIVQGAFDAQVTPVDAHLLAGARPDATLTILPTMNHVLKAEISAALPQASYADPARPLAPGLGDALAAALR